MPHEAQESHVPRHCYNLVSAGEASLRASEFAALGWSEEKVWGSEGGAAD